MSFKDVFCDILCDDILILIQGIEIGVPKFSSNFIPAVQ